MSAAAALLGYLALATTLGPLALRGDWTHRCPATALRCWQALCASVLLTAALVPLTLAVPYLPVDHVLAHVLRADAAAVAEHYRGPMGLVPVLAAHLLLGLALTSLAVSTARQVSQTARVRRRQRHSLALVGRPRAGGYVEVPSATPAIWCLPGRRPVVAVTTGAREVLAPAELRAALLHERHHLRARHGATVGLARALARALPGMPPFAAAERATAVLVELAADDAARLPDQRRSLRRALVLLSTGAPPPGALAATGTATLLRVRRLAEADPAHGRVRRSLPLAAAILLLAGPVLVALSPALEAALHHCLPA